MIFLLIFFILYSSINVVKNIISSYKRHIIHLDMIRKIQSLEQENTKLKKEIELLKLQMEEQHKFYMS